MRADIDRTFVETVVDALVTIHCRVEEGDLGGREPGPLATPTAIDAALSLADLDTVVRPPDTARFAADGGDERSTTRETDEGVLVVVDLHGIDRNDYETEVDTRGNSLVLTVDERFVWRVPVEGDPTSITDVSVNNDVLEVRVDLAG